MFELNCHLLKGVQSQSQKNHYGRFRPNWAFNLIYQNLNPFRFWFQKWFFIIFDTLMLTLQSSKSRIVCLLIFKVNQDSQVDIIFIKPNLGLLKEGWKSCRAKNYVGMCMKGSIYWFCMAKPKTCFSVTMKNMRLCLFISFKHRNIFEGDSNIFQKYLSQPHTLNAKEKVRER